MMERVAEQLLSICFGSTLFSALHDLTKPCAVGLVVTVPVVQMRNQGLSQ